MALNYYDVLNVSKDADNKAISEAYKKMALKWHPDKNPDNFDEANRQFQQISQAYQVLSDSEKRMRYDRGESIGGRCFHDFDYDDEDDDDEYFSFFQFVTPEMLFRHFFRQYEERRAFHTHNRRDSRKSSVDSRNEKRNKNDGHIKETCQTRTVNGKQWMTKTAYEDGKKVVTRYEDGELISKQIDGVFQKISK